MQISQRAIEILIRQLESQIDNLERELADEKEETFALYSFLKGDKVTLVKWIEFVYENHPEAAKRIVEAYHDDILDLSKIECCKSDFKPW